MYKEFQWRCVVRRMRRRGERWGRGREEGESDGYFTFEGLIMAGKPLIYYRLSLRSQRCRSNKPDNPIFSSSSPLSCFLSAPRRRRRMERARKKDGYRLDSPNLKMERTTLLSFFFFFLSVVARAFVRIWVKRTECFFLVRKGDTNCNLRRLDWDISHVF